MENTATGKWAAGLIPRPYKAFCVDSRGCSGGLLWLALVYVMLGTSATFSEACLWGNGRFARKNLAKSLLNQGERLIWRYPTSHPPPLWDVPTPPKDRQ